MIRSVDTNYDWSIFLEGDYDIPAYSCATYQPQDTPDVYEPYGGFPTSYVLENTTIYQLWWDDKELFDNLGKLLDIDVVSISSIKQPCGSTVARHRDFFYKIKTQFPNDTRTHVRAIIYLEDWDPGHMLQYEVGGNWLNSTHWKAGQGFTWDENHEHISMNAGLKPKYTLQVSGFDIKE